MAELIDSKIAVSPISGLPLKQFSQLRRKALNLNVPPWGEHRSIMLLFLIYLRRSVVQSGSGFLYVCRRLKSDSLELRGSPLIQYVGQMKWPKHRGAEEKGKSREILSLLYYYRVTEICTINLSQVRLSFLFFRFELLTLSMSTDEEAKNKARLSRFAPFS